MNELRAGLPPLPAKMQQIPIDRRGYPVPYFVAIIDGEPDHRVVDPVKLRACLTRGVCWLCGQPLGRFKAFVIGPMCAVTRTSAEPPSHRECARYAAMACPFMTRPHMHRREAGLPEARHEPGGIMLMRNPGATCVWVTSEHRPFRSRHGHAGVLFDIGAPESTEWFAEGRAATRSEVDTSIYSGLHLLTEQAKLDGEAGLADLAQKVAATTRLLDECAALN